MQQATSERTPDAADELWLVQHPPVFTLGRAAKREHLLRPAAIPVVETDRGGQVTYHGPGQAVIYTLLDVRRLGIGPRELVRRIEQGVIDYLAAQRVTGERRQGAPGVYVNGAKIAALGLRIRRAFSYHGLALNVAMDLEPFRRINPCGYAGLAVTDLKSQGRDLDVDAVWSDLCDAVVAALYPDHEPVVQYAGAFDSRPSSASRAMGLDTARSDPPVQESSYSSVES